MLLNESKEKSGLSKKNEFDIIEDEFKKNRGNYSIILNIHCTTCHCYLISYQKDGPGPLLRCYLDRIHQKFYFQQENESMEKNLFCPNCNQQVGIYSIYTKENRPSYEMVEGSSYFFIVNS